MTNRTHLSCIAVVLLISNVIGCTIDADLSDGPRRYHLNLKLSQTAVDITRSGNPPDVLSNITSLDRTGTAAVAYRDTRHGRAQDITP